MKKTAIRIFSLWGGFKHEKMVLFHFVGLFFLNGLFIFHLGLFFFRFGAAFSVRGGGRRQAGESTAWPERRRWSGGRGDGVKWGGVTTERLRHRRA